MKTIKSGAPAGNKNASGKRVERDRVSVNMGISVKNGLLELFSRYLSEQGIEPTDDNIKETARRWAYTYWAERLKREIEIIDQATII